MSAGTRRRADRRSGPQFIPPNPPEDVMQQQHPQPAPPVLPANDDALAVMWAGHAPTVSKARVSAQEAEIHETNATKRWADAQAARDEAARLRADADRADVEAAKAEAEATAEDKTARLHRQDEAHHNDTAAKVAATVDYLRATNGLMHPEERRMRAEQAAAANAAANGGASALDTPIGNRVSADMGATAPFSTVGTEAAL